MSTATKKTADGRGILEAAATRLMAPSRNSFAEEIVTMPPPGFVHGIVQLNIATY